jgi:hypothetical protein
MIDEAPMWHAVGADLKTQILELLEHHPAPDKTRRCLQRLRGLRPDDGAQQLWRRGAGLLDEKL